MAMSHGFVARKIALSSVTLYNQKYSCRMSLSILSPMSPVEFKKSPSRSVDLRNGCVTLSNLRVNSHTDDFIQSKSHRAHR